MSEAGEEPEDWTMQVGVLMAVYHRSDAEIYEMDEDRMVAILSTFPSILRLLYGVKIDGVRVA